MSTVRASLLLATILLTTTTASAQKQSSRRTTAEAVKQKGFEMVKFADIDVDGDGRRELIVLAKDKEGLRLLVVGDDKEGAVVTQVLPPVGGRELVTFKGQQLVKATPAQQVILEVIDETPDEKVKRIRVYAGKDGRLQQTFTSVLNRSKKVDERDEWERDDSIIKYGDPRGGWYLADIEEDGVTEILVRRKAQILRIPGDDGDEKVLTGVREQVWRWDDSTFAFLERGERLNNFLPSLPVASVTASSAWIEPMELKEIKRNALSDALMKTGKTSEGAMGGEFDFALEDLDSSPPTKQPPPKPPVVKTPPKKKEPVGDDGAAAKADPKKPAGKKAKKPEPEPEPEIEIDRSSYMTRAADNNLATGWVEDAPGDGKGEWVELTLEEESNVKMVRIVTGCVDTKQTFSAFNVPEVFDIRFDGGSDATVNRREPKKFDKPIVAFSDSIIKLKDRPWAKTTLVFYDGKRSAKKVRITLDKAIKQGKDNNTCISEVSVH
ncbi:MAG TPA: hypothetical protein VGF99_01375 [Myxococcota bacterium]